MDGSADEIERLAARLGDRRWRLENLYWILDKGGRRVLFKPNAAQEELLRNLHYLNVILKARQLGFCLSDQTLTLTADLRWVPIGTLRVGDELVACDEDVPGGKGASRKMRTAVVQAVREVYEPAFRIVMSDGRELIATGPHRFLSRKAGTNAEWRSIESPNKKKLRVGDDIRWVTKPWGEQGVEDAWYGGLADGEGCLHVRSSGVELNVSQIENGVLERARRYLADRGYSFRIESDQRPLGAVSKLGSKVVHKLCLSRMNELFRLIGQTRPTRFIGRRWWEGKDLPGKRTGEGWATIVAIEPLGPRRMIDIQTSTGTFIAEGFVSHNSTLIQILILDLCLFNSNVSAGVVAHTKEDAEAIFDTKIKYAYDNLPAWLQETRPAENDRAGELKFANGSRIRVATSLRSGTYQIVHISEYGKICRKSPERAKEVKTGTLQTVAAGQYVFIESTAEGKFGDFYEIVQAARRRAQDARPLNPLEYRIHFFPWFADAAYRADPEGVPIPDKLTDYFALLEGKTGAKIDAHQRAWYALKSLELGDDMKQEYPATPDEAFEQSVEGAYYTKQMAMLRRQGQIRKIPVAPSVPVHSFWDLGRNDTTAIWLMQEVAGQCRFLKCYENSGEGLEHFVKWINSHGYIRGKFYLPHDAEQRRLGVNAGGDCVVDHLMAMNIPSSDLVIVPRITNVLDGIEAVRQVLPETWIDPEGCAEGIIALDSYRKEWDERLGVWRDTPRHDQHSNYADAFRQFAQGYQRGQSLRQRLPTGGRVL